MSARENQQAEAIRETVRGRYTNAAQRTGDAEERLQAALAIGYGVEELGAVPGGANLGLGCGNPTAIDTLQAGEVVVDLGSGAGMDVFIAARKVGPTGCVIGIDMTEAMIAKAQANAVASGLDNVEFHLGLIEELPLEDEVADAIISNCVINLSPDKERVYREAYRVLKPRGRAMISDIVLEQPLPPDALRVVDRYLGCVGSASLASDYLHIIRQAGFRGARIVGSRSMAEVVSLDQPAAREAMAELDITEDRALELLARIYSVSIFARK